MKKVILGCTLMLSATIILCTEYLKEVLYFTSEYSHSMGASYWLGGLLALIGIALCVLGFGHNTDKK